MAKSNKLSEEQILGNKDVIEKLIAQFEEPRKSKILALLEGFIGDEYFTAPASAREDYHSAYPGGLAEHSLRVVKNLRLVAKALAPDKYSLPVLDFVGLFHDLGKTGDGIEPYYIPNPYEPGRKRGYIYEINKDCVHMPTQERSLYLLQKHGIELTTDEYLAIRLHDGQYDPSNKNYAMNEPDLALLVHFADRWSCSQEKSYL